MVNVSLTPTTSPVFLQACYDRDALQKYLTLIGTDQIIQVLLRCDRNNQIIDKWLAAIVFEYFISAKLMPHQFTREKFCLALYLAVEFEEDEDRKIKDVLLDYLLHHDNNWSNKKQFVRKKDKFWRKLGFRCMVPEKRLQHIISLDPYHCIWQRERKRCFGGANRSFICKIDPPSFYKLQWPLQTQQHQKPQQKLPIFIDLTQDSPPRAAPPVVKKTTVKHPNKRTSAAYRHLHSIVTLINHDRGRRKTTSDILKIKHAQQRKLNEIQMLNQLARSSSFMGLQNELNHLTMGGGVATPLQLFNQSCLNTAITNLYSNSSNNYKTNALHLKSENSDTINLSNLILHPEYRRLAFAGLPNLDANGNPEVPPSVMVPSLNTDHWV